MLYLKTNFFDLFGSKGILRQKQPYESPYEKGALGAYTPPSTYKRDKQLKRIELFLYLSLNYTLDACQSWRNSHNFCVYVIGHIHIQFIICWNVVGVLSLFYAKPINIIVIDRRKQIYSSWKTIYKKLLFEYSRENEVREWIFHFGLITDVIPLKLFLDMVSGTGPSSSSDVICSLIGCFCGINVEE